MIREPENILEHRAYFYCRAFWYGRLTETSGSNLSLSEVEACAVRDWHKFMTNAKLMEKIIGEKYDKGSLSKT